MAEQSEFRIFVSCSAWDREYVSRLVDHLDESGFEVFGEPEIPAGARWTDQVRDAISGCDAFVAVVSDRYMASEWAQTETALAYGSEKPVLPVMVRNCQPEGILSHVQMLDATSDFDRGAREVGDLLGEWRDESMHSGGIVGVFQPDDDLLANQPVGRVSVGRLELGLDLSGIEPSDDAPTIELWQEDS